MKHVREKLHPKTSGRLKRKNRVKKKIHGVGSNRPRLSVFRSNRHVCAQIIDDEKGTTLVSVSTQEKAFAGKTNAGNCEGAKEIGKVLAERALAKSIKEVMFDRGGFLYHGRVKALADGAREGGLQF